MYCECAKPHIVESSAEGKTFKVCSKRLGGCGKEISLKPRGHKTIETDLTNCKKCSGTGQIRQAYSMFGGSGSVPCDMCGGFGIIADLDDDYSWRD